MQTGVGPRPGRTWHLAPGTSLSLSVFLSLPPSLCLSADKNHSGSQRPPPPTRPRSVFTLRPFAPRGPYSPLRNVQPRRFLCNELEDPTARQPHESGVLCAPLPWLPTASDEGRDALRAVCQSGMPAPRMTYMRPNSSQLIDFRPPPLLSSASWTRVAWQRWTGERSPRS